jgi:hypothetical protein
MVINLSRFLLIVVFGVFIFSASAYAQSDPSDPKETVNILTWWGYLDCPGLVSMVEKECNVKISYDSYYTNREFLRRWRTQGQIYDIIVFSDTIYDVIKDEIALEFSSLHENLRLYPSIIKKQHENNKFPPNVVFYTHSLTGFLWNPKIISLAKDDSLYSIFKKAGEKIIIIMDDSAEIQKLISLGYYETVYGKKKYKKYKDKLISLTIENFKKLIQQTKLFITNDYSKAYTNKNFAFAFMWSGDAISNLKKSKKRYKFLVHDNLSYVSSDLLANLNNKPYVVATAKALTSRKAMDIVQNNEYYFSPHLDLSNVTEPVFKQIYRQFIKKLPDLSWIKSIPEHESYITGISWNKIRLNINKKKNYNN